MPSQDGIVIIQSATPSETYGPGINGAFKIYTYPNANPVIGSRKYGPKIELQNGKWIVTEASGSDVINNKVGDEYKGFDGKTIQHQDNNGLTIYSIESGDEGVSNNRFAFVAKGRLHEVYLPAYSDGTYATETPNDPKPYNTLMQRVRDSITPIE